MCLHRSVPLALCIGLLAVAAGAQKLALDSAWWIVSRVGEKTGFVLGFGDCPNAGKFVSGLSSEDYIAFIDSRLASTANKSPDAVPRILRSATHLLAPKPILKGGEEYPEKHGSLDGEWWGDATHGDADEKVGYVEGYLSCEFGLVDKRATTSYVRLLNIHYSNPAKEHDKVANVLQPAIDRRRRLK